MHLHPNERGTVASPTPGDSVPPARNDPVRGALPGQELAYETLQLLWSAWARKRYREEFDRVQTFCLFIGYPRSGHSLVGAMLNAHRHAVISHELDASKLILAGCTRDDLYARILARAAWFNLRGNRSNYRYQIPNRWQGRFESLRVIGDKRGGTAALSVAEHPDLLKRLRAVVGVPLRLVHVVRNPYDNIAAIARWHRLSLDESIAFYFAHFQTTGNLDALSDPAHVLTIHHEELVRAPEATLANLCTFLGLNHDAQYLAECSSVVFARPTQPRRRTEWTPAQLAEVERRTRVFPFLTHYHFEAGDEAPRSSSERSTTPLKMPHLSERIAAYFNPRV